MLDSASQEIYINLSRPNPGQREKKLKENEEKKPLVF